MGTAKLLVTALALSALPLLNSVDRSSAGVLTAAAVAPAATAAVQGALTEQVWWRNGWGWRRGGWGWRGGYGWRRGWGPGWVAPAIVGGAIVGGALASGTGCWHWQPTPWGPRRVAGC